MDLHLDMFLLGVVSLLILHKYTIPGDYEVLLEAAISLALFCLSLYQNLGIYNAVLIILSKIAVHCSTMVSLLILWRISPFHPLASFPGPFLNKITNLRMAYIVSTGKRHLTIKEYHEKYGTFVRTGPNTISINSASAIGPIYASANAMNKSRAYRLGKVEAHGLFFIRDKDDRAPRRNLWAKAFTPSALEGYRPALEKRTKELVNYLEEHSYRQERIEFTDILQRWVYDLMGEVTFGGSSGLELLRDGDPVGFVRVGQMATKMLEILGEVPWLFDILWHVPAANDIHALEELGAKFMSDRLDNESEDHVDLCSYLLREQKETQTRLTRDELNVESLFAVQAGSDATATVLCTIFAYIFSDKRVYDLLVAELMEALPDPEQAFDHSKLANLPYLNAAIDEALRLGTPFPGLARVVPPAGALLAGRFIPGETIVSVPIYTAQVVSENFAPAPEAFLPERWLPGGLAGAGIKVGQGEEEVCNRNALLCFSFGPFGCLGRQLAMEETRLTIAYVLRMLDVRLTEDCKADEFLTGITNIKSTFFARPLMVTAERR